MVNMTKILFSDPNFYFRDTLQTTHTHILLGYEHTFYVLEWGCQTHFCFGPRQDNECP